MIKNINLTDIEYPQQIKQKKQYTQNPNFRANDFERTPKQDKVELSNKTNDITKAAIGVGIVGAIVTLGILGRKGKLGSYIQELLGGAKKSKEQIKESLEKLLEKHKDKKLSELTNEEKNKILEALNPENKADVKQKIEAEFETMKDKKVSEVVDSIKDKLKRIKTDTGNPPTGGTGSTGSTVGSTGSTGGSSGSSSSRSSGSSSSSSTGSTSSTGGSSRSTSGSGGSSSSRSSGSSSSSSTGSTGSTGGSSRSTGGSSSSSSSRSSSSSSSSSTGSTGSTGSSSRSTGHRTWNTGNNSYTDDFLQKLEEILPIMKQKRISDKDFEKIADLFKDIENMSADALKNGDTKLYRKLMMKYHPDKNPHDEVAAEITTFFNFIYH